MVTAPVRTTLTSELENAIGLARTGNRVAVDVLERTIRRLIAAESTPPQLEPDDRTTIDREPVIAAVRMLGFDPARAFEVHVNPHFVHASLISPTKPEVRGMDLSHRLRIVDTPTPPVRSTIAKPGDNPAADGF